MFIKNPNPKEPYTFRVNPEELEKLKQYAKATNTTVPEILNEMIEEKTKGYFLTDDYLTEKEVFIQNRGILGLPTLEEMYNEGKYKEFDLLDYNKNGYLVELQRVPNNLDFWDDKKGYTSQKRGIDHEGIDFVLIPDLVYSVTDFENEDLLKCCLVPIYFTTPTKTTKPVTIINISFDNAISKIRESQKIELLDKAKNYELMVTETIHTYINKVKNATQKGEFYYTSGIVHESKEGMVGYFKTELVIALHELAEQINTNIVPQQEGAFKRQHYETLEDLLPTDTKYKELLEENQALKQKADKMEETLQDLTTQVNEMKNLTKQVLNGISPEDLEKLKKSL